MKNTKRSGKTGTMGSKSLERFMHFQCGSCRKWWGIGDAPARKKWYCPWCATKQSFVDKTPRDIG